jgi:hypothetical protein
VYQRHPRFGVTKHLVETQPIAPVSDPPEVYLAPEGELLFWHTMLGWLLSPTSPNFVSRTLQFLFVAPYTNVTNFSLFYQQYLNELVHRKFMYVLLTVALWTSTRS